MMVRTVLRLRLSRRAISRTEWPSWWSRNTALRLSVSIMELPQGVKEGPRAAQDASAQQMALRVKGPAGQFVLFLALAHHSLHIFLRQFQVPQQDPLKLAAPIGVWGHLAHPGQRQRQVAFADFLPERRRSAKEPVRQLFNLAHAQALATERQNELLDLLGTNPVQAHELAQAIHEAVNGKGPGEELPAHRLAHLRQESQTHAHPTLAAGQRRRDVRHAPVTHGFEFVDE